MKCAKCNKEKEIHRFYYGFFSSEYDKSKWCYLCDKCIKEFLKCSNVAGVNINPLMEFYNALNKKEKTRKRGAR